MLLGLASSHCYSTFSKAVGLREKYSVTRKLICARQVAKAICSWCGLCVWDYGVIRCEASEARARDWNQSMLYIDRNSLLCTACHHEWFFLSQITVDSNFMAGFGHSSLSGELVFIYLFIFIENIKIYKQTWLHKIRFFRIGYRKDIAWGSST